MSRSISVGIDVGSQHIKIVVVESLDNGLSYVSEKKASDWPRSRAHTKVLGVGISEARGVEHGYVVNSGECSRSIRSALNAAEKATGIKIKRVNASVSGVGLLGHIFHGAVNINKNSGEVTSSDIFKVQENARTEIPESLSQNRKILHIFPLQYRIDGKTVLGHPEGLKGLKLEVKVFAITCLIHHLNDLVDSIEDAGVKVEDVIAGPLLVSSNSISKAERRAGVGVINIKSETVSLIVYEDSLPISLEVFAIGSNDITNDIALGLKTSLQEAEQIKLGMHEGKHSKKKIEEIINARLADIFELVENHLKRISKSGLLPAGVVLLGGGSKLPGIENFAKSYLKLPTRKIEDKPEWIKAYGAAMYGIYPEDIIEPEETGGMPRRNFFSQIGRWFKQFLP